jgi:hypothetical protein
MHSVIIMVCIMFASLQIFAAYTLCFFPVSSNSTTLDVIFMLDVVLFLGYGENTNYAQHQVTFFTHGLLSDKKSNFIFLLCMWVYLPTLHVGPKCDENCT